MSKVYLSNRPPCAKMGVVGGTVWLGNAADDLQRGFERLYQVDKSVVRRGSGAGPGLAVAQEIIELHGNRIRAESASGLGTRLTVELQAKPE